MKKKLATLLICLILLVSTMAFLLSGCSGESVITLNDLPNVEIDNSIPIMTGDNNKLLLGNIDRGFRLETYYTLGSGRAWPVDAESDGYEMLYEEIEYYKEDMAREIQVYIYLTEYNNKPLDDLAFLQMQKYFETIRDLRMSMLLRFAYDYDQPSDISPTEDVMLGHFSQIKQFIRNNKELINDTVTAYQFGCIGAWGEWGGTKQKYNEKKVLNALIDMFPEDTYFQGRYMRVVNQTDKNPQSEYVGYHNDFLVARPHPWNTAGNKHSSSDYKKFFKNAPYRLNDGEMPWGGYTDEPNEIVDGISFLKQMREHSMGTLSIKHNYKENKTGSEGNKHNIWRWQSEYVTPEILKANQLPYYENWFKDSNGNVIKRSIYDYLRDFLGYHLVLSNLKMQGDNLSFVVTNFGLGTPLTLDSMHIALTDGDNNTEYLSVQGFDVKKLTTCDQIKINIKLNTDIVGKRIGVKIARKCSSGDYNIRTANNVPFENGINYIA